MYIDTSETLAASVASLIPLDPPPAEALIDQFLERIAAAFDVPADLTAETRKLLHAKYSIRMEMGKTLLSEEEHDEFAVRVAGVHRYNVTEGFPRIIQPNVPAGVDEVCYLVELAAARDFEIIGRDGA